ncbi:MAG TPA: hypothetical protein VNS88_12965 [Nitrospiraceae bacterium]|nr:hypothetical protein [Nitrospiraceae bacterium]
MNEEDDIAEAVDSIVDDVDVDIEREADKLGISSSELADRVANEIKARDRD